ncbi:MAG: hypothetical protein A2Y38_26755 [Spirochaetes bacterium GWB1_59_5]|nr:MAG: hypothetical protein A2Y38_26755 [Spirochaetes bacterium GWB1_59_5]
MWEQYEVPRSEGTRIHRIGSMLICVAVEMAGEGDLLSAMPMYDAALSLKKTTRKNVVSSVTLPPLDDPVWYKFFIDSSKHYELLPGYPQIPVCVRLKEAFSLPPGADLKGWIFSRIEARILVSGVELVSFPLAKPHKTLYGTPETGVICRYDEAQFLTSSEPMFESMLTDPGLVAHPVRLRNTSSTAVRVTELCIYGEQLSIFWTGARMQSERLSFVFGSSGVRMSLDGQGSLSPDWTTIAKPRVSGEERFIERSFELFKAMTRL